MDPNIQAIINSCEWFGSSFFIISQNVFSPLLYYTYAGSVIPTLLIVLFVFWKARSLPAARYLILMGLFFAVWIFSNLVTWATEIPAYTMFFWSILILVEPLVYFFAACFTYSIVRGKDVPWWLLTLLAAPLIPTILLAPTHLGLSSYDLTNCDRAANEGVIALYGYIIEFLYVAYIVAFTLVSAHQEKDKGVARRNILLAGGAVAFLLSFSLGNILEVFTENWYIGQYGLLGAPIFTAVLAYSIVRYKMFNIKLLGAQALVIGLWLLIFSLLFVRDISNVRFAIIPTLGLLIIFGFSLIRSIKREIRQREEIEKLAEKLKQANKRLRELDRQKSEFVSIASHQLRSPLTAIRGYASMLVEGSFGAIPKKAQEAVERIHESSRYMALSIEDFLNVSRIEQGRMKYELSDFNLREVAEKVVDELRPAGIKKGLVLMFRSECTSGCVINADIGKVRQVLYNLIDNAMKYTPKGSITVIAHDDLKQKKMYVTVHDTGVGMSKETLGAIFEKFVRAKNANSVNVSGTGLGLFVAKQMIEAMGGKVTPASDGEGKGSKFTLELPLV